MAAIATSPTPSPAPFPPSAPKDEKIAARERFQAVYTTIYNDFIDDFRKRNMPEDVIEYYRRSMDYNVPGGKQNRGQSVVDSVTILMGRELTEKEHFKAAILGWAVEWMQAYVLVADDIMDSGVTRRGQPCWYRLDGVGLKAISELFVIEGAIFQILRKHFRKEPIYVDLMNLLHDASYQTTMGQLVDLLASPVNSVDLSKFSLAKHRTIITYKTALYTFYLPVALALLICGFPIERQNESDPDCYKIALDILVPLGEYFQIRDDYLDYSGTPEKIGKIGTDIVDNKCSWCINIALARASLAQRAILDANYGRKDPEAEARVKEVFREVGVDAAYAEYEAESHARINALIDAAPEVQSPNGDAVLRRAVFREYLEKTY